MTVTTGRDTVVIERLFNHPPERVWRALTQQWLIAEWLMANDFRPDVGHRFTLKTTPMPYWDGVVECEVLEIEPMSRLVYSWNTNAPDGAVGLETIVQFTVTETDSGTLVRIEQSGFRADQPDNWRGAQYGWGRNLQRLAEQLVGMD
jgi:uncharacterized protein YndB with AHSA1/START domain